MTSATRIPVIDLEPLRLGDLPARHAVAREIEEACTTSGFFTIVGHGVPQELIARTRQAGVDFFAAPDAVKQAVLRPPSKISRGWNPIKDRTIAYSRGEKTPPDWQEAWAMGPIDVGDDPYYTEGAGKSFFAPNQWPDMPGFRETLEEYYRAMLGLAQHVMRGFALALGADEHYFDDKADRGYANLRIVRYPGQDDPPEPGQLRAGAHTDYGAFTFVKGDNVPGGLQVSDGGDGWIDVQAPDGGYVCNIADAMQRWTNDVLRSTLHRVVNPPREVARQDRISIVTFHNPNHDTVLRGIGDSGTDGEPPLTFAEHYFGKIVRAAGTSSATAEELVGKTAAE